MFMKKKEEKDLSWYQDKLAQLYEELYVMWRCRLNGRM